MIDVQQEAERIVSAILMEISNKKPGAIVPMSQLVDLVVDALLAEREESVKRVQDCIFQGHPDTTDPMRAYELGLEDAVEAIRATAQQGGSVDDD